MQINGKSAAAALVKARAAMKATVTKDSKGNFGKYADLATVVAAITPALSDNGLALVQEIAVDAETVTVSATLLHETGETAEFWPMVLPVGDRKGAQAIGAVITYARRYQLMALFGLAPDDDLDAQTPQEAPGAQKQRSMTTDTRAPYNARPNASTQPETQIDAVPEVDQNGPETPAHQRMFGVGLSVFGPAWNNGARAWLLRGYTKHTTPGNIRSSSTELSDDEKVLVADYMSENAAELQAAWQKMERKRAAEAERGQPA